MAHIVLMTLGLWFVYIAVMWLRKNRIKIKKKGKGWYYLAYAFATTAFLLDMAYNITVGSVIFLDPPREFLFTARLKRYRTTPVAAWRVDLATFFCEKMLNPYDSEHC